MSEHLKPTPEDEYVVGCPRCSGISACITVQYELCEEHRVVWRVRRYAYLPGDHGACEPFDPQREAEVLKAFDTFPEIDPLSLEPCPRCGSITEHHSIYCQYPDGAPTPIPDVLVRQMTDDFGKHLVFKEGGFHE